MKIIDKIKDILPKLSKTWQLTKNFYNSIKDKLKDTIKKAKKIIFDIQIFVNGNYLYYKKVITAYILNLKKIWLSKKLDKTADKIATILDKEAKLNGSNMIDIQSIIPMAENIPIQ